MAASRPGHRHTRPDVETQSASLSPVCRRRRLVSVPQEEGGAKADARGDSAGSKGTTDSGVVMEAAQLPSLPGQVPRPLPVTDGESDHVRLEWFEFDK